MKKLYTVSRNKPEPTVAVIMLIAKFRLKLKKLGKTTRPFRYESESCSVVSDSLQPQGLCTPWNSPGQNTGQIAFPSPGDFPNPGIEPRSSVLQVVSLPVEPQGMPKNTGVGTEEDYPFSSRSSKPRNWTRVSCVAGRFFTNWAIREAQAFM